jgi:hypothetical protein
LHLLSLLRQFSSDFLETFPGMHNVVREAKLQMPCVIGLSLRAPATGVDKLSLTGHVGERKRGRNRNARMPPRF